MNIAGYKINQKQLIITLILLIGLAVTVILVQRPQIFKGRAEIEVSSGLNIQGSYGEGVSCSGQICETKASDVIIEITDPNIFLQD